MSDKSNSAKPNPAKQKDLQQGGVKEQGVGRKRAPKKGKASAPLPPASTAFPDSAAVWQEFFRCIAQEFREE
ncbi:hypothetical protein D2Q93_16590 [Alicyclobacillaceae bacterium I2511]|jgi:hypothetical protein|nr:hypothetical protein D2Q93_16590 [Alicyclobacillaceae bacterium I2511]